MVGKKEKYLVAAQKFVDRGQLDKAIAELAKVVDEDPTDTRTWLRMAELHAKRSAVSEAVVIYLKTADLYVEQGFAQKAIAVYKNLLKLAPGTVTAHLKLGGLYKGVGLISDAVQQFEQASAAEQRAGKGAEAVAALRQAVDAQPDNVALRVKLAELASQVGLAGDAVEELGRAAEQLKAQGRSDEYCRVLERLLFHRPEDRAKAYELAETYIARGNTHQALPKLQACLNTDPRDVQALSLLAKALEQLGETPKAVEVLKELAEVCDGLGRSTERDAAILRALTLAPSDVDVRAIADRHRLRGADPIADQMTPPPIVAASRIGAAAGEFAPSGSGLFTKPGPDTGSFDRPGSVETSNLGRVLPAGATAETGRQSLSGPIGAAEPEVARILAESEVFIKYGIFERAVDHLRRVFVVDPQHRAGREKLAEVLEQLGRKGEAAEELVTVADQMVAAGGSTSAIQPILARAVALDPSSARAREKLERLEASAAPVVPLVPAAPSEIPLEQQDGAQQDGAQQDGAQDVLPQAREVGHDDVRENGRDLVGAPGQPAGEEIREAAPDESPAEAAPSAQAEEEVVLDAGSDGVMEVVDPTSAPAQSSPDRSATDEIPAVLEKLLAEPSEPEVTGELDILEEAPADTFSLDDGDREQQRTVVADAPAGQLADVAADAAPDVLAEPEVIMAHPIEEPSNVTESNDADTYEMTTLSESAAREILGLDAGSAAASNGQGEQEPAEAPREGASGGPEAAVDPAADMVTPPPVISFSNAATPAPAPASSLSPAPPAATPAPMADFGASVEAVASFQLSEPAPTHVATFDTSPEKVAEIEGVDSEPDVESETASQVAPPVASQVPPHFEVDAEPEFEPDIESEMDAEADAAAGVVEFAADVPTRAAPAWFDPMAASRAAEDESPPPTVDETEVESELDQADFFLEQGMPDEALSLLTDLATRFPGHPRIETKRAEVERAEQQLAAMNRLDYAPAEPGGAIPGTHIERLGDAREVTPAPVAIVADGAPVDYATHADLGIAYKEMGLYDPAIAEFKIVTQDPEREVFALTMMGECFEAKGAITEAVIRYKRALNCEQVTQAENIALYFLLGAAFERLGDVGEALYFYEKVAKRDAKFRDVDQKIATLKPRLARRA